MYAKPDQEGEEYRSQSPPSWSSCDCHGSSGKRPEWRRPIWAQIVNTKDAFHESVCVQALVLAGSLVVTPPAIGYAVEALRAEPGVESNGAVTVLRRGDNDNDQGSTHDNDNADAVTAPPEPAPPEGVDQNPNNNDPNNNGDNSGSNADTGGGNSDPGSSLSN